MDRLVIDQRTVPALQIFDQEIVVAVQEFTWRDENDRMIGCPSYLFVRTDDIDNIRIDRLACCRA